MSRSCTSSHVTHVPVLTLRPTPAPGVTVRAHCHGQRTGVPQGQHVPGRPVVSGPPGTPPPKTALRLLNMVAEQPEGGSTVLSDASPQRGHRRPSSHTVRPRPCGPAPADEDRDLSGRCTHAGATEKPSGMSLRYGVPRNMCRVFPLRRCATSVDMTYEERSAAGRYVLGLADALIATTSRRPDEPAHFSGS